MNWGEKFTYVVKADKNSHLRPLFEEKYKYKMRHKHKGLFATQTSRASYLLEIRHGQEHPYSIYIIVGGSNCLVCIPMFFFLLMPIAL